MASDPCAYRSWPQIQACSSSLGPFHLVPSCLSSPALLCLLKASCHCPSSAQALAQGAFYRIGKGLRKQVGGCGTGIGEPHGHLPSSCLQAWAVGTVPSKSRWVCPPPRSEVLLPALGLQLARPFR